MAVVGVRWSRTGALQTTTNVLNGMERGKVKHMETFDKLRNKNCPSCHDIVIQYIMCVHAHVCVSVCVSVGGCVCRCVCVTVCTFVCLSARACYRETKNE